MRFPRLAQVSLTKSDKDEYTVEDTLAGSVETVYFYDRADFEKAVIALAYKLEPRDIPKSMGALFINGLIDHVKQEKVALIILSRGGYSGVSTDMLGGDLQGISEEKWEAFSLSIRKHHEIAHFIQRKLFPENKNALRDEIKADMVGIIETFGKYDESLARLLLGIEGSDYRKGGRLENYVSEAENIESTRKKAEEYISCLKRYMEQYHLDGPESDKAQSEYDYKKGLGFDILVDVEKNESAKDLCSKD